MNIPTGVIYVCLNEHIFLRTSNLERAIYFEGFEGTDIYTTRRLLEARRYDEKYQRLREELCLDEAVEAFTQAHQRLFERVEEIVRTAGPVDPDVIRNNTRAWRWNSVWLKGEAAAKAFENPV